MTSNESPASLAGGDRALKSDQLGEAAHFHKATSRKLQDPKCRCRECGGGIVGDRGKEFCRAECRSAFHNRRKRRGADLYDLLMAQRFDRDAAQHEGAWSFLCRMAAEFRAEDERERGGRRSWDSVSAVKARHPDVAAVKLTAVRRAS